MVLAGYGETDRIFGLMSWGCAMEVPVYVMLSLGAVGVRSRARIPLPSRPLAGAAWARMLFSTSALPLPPLNLEFVPVSCACQTQKRVSCSAV